MITEESVSFNFEEDSLSTSILGTKTVPGTVEFDLFVKDMSGNNHKDEVKNVRLFGESSFLKISLTSGKSHF